MCSMKLLNKQHIGWLLLINRANHIRETCTFLCHALEGP